MPLDRYRADVATLLGRDEEQARFAGALDDARLGRSHVLVVEGEAGIGKTTLLAGVAATASDFTVLWVSGCESEQELTYATLHQLLGPLLPRYVELPDPQRRALGAAFGLLDALPVDRFLLSLAVLSLLGTAAQERPVLVIVDDAHLVDEGSLSVLSFVARRLDADRISIVYSLRSDQPTAPLAGFPVLSLSGLPEAVVGDLLRERTGVRVDVSVASRLVATTGGSPLAIAEIGGLLSEHQLAGREELPDPLPIGRRLEAHFDDIVRSLPESGRRLLLVAAAASAGPDHGFIPAAAKTLECWPEGLDSVERAGLLHLDPMPRFGHPLVRSVIYAGSPAEERRTAHRSLAESATAAGDVVRAAWHLGLAASEPDEAVAARLDAVADDALERGGCGMAAAFRTRAAVLTPDRTLRVGRCVAAAQNLLLSGSAAQARDLLAELVPDLDDRVQRGEAQRLHGQVRYATGEATGTVSVLVAAAQDLRDIDRQMARDTLLDGLSAAQLAGSSPQAGESYADVARVARGMPLLPGADPTIADRLLDAAAAVHLEGAVAARPLLLQALAEVAALGSSLDQQGRPTELVRWLGLGCWTAGVLADDVHLLVLARRLEAAARPHGALASLSVALLHLAMARLAQGLLPTARDHLAERTALQEAMGWPADVGELIVRSWGGDADGARTEAARVAELASSYHHHWMLVFSDYASSVLELGLGRYDAALEPARRTYWENPTFALVGFPNLVEAAARADASELAAEAAPDLSARAGAEPSPLVSALLETAAALAAGPSTAEAHYEAALQRLPWPEGALRGRIALLYGEWLRRRKRKLDAREQLRSAHAALVASGASAFADRARRELAAAGERTARAVDGGSSTLTPQEAQIARLATTGATNAEIAAQLFLSSSTVDYHLRKVFRKLGVTSRRQLGANAGLRDPEDSAASSLPAQCGHEHRT
jgi:DNA-binding CsgD family transcriptional regulator